MAVADVYVANECVGYLKHLDGGRTEFAYFAGAAMQVATSLPISTEPVISHGGALPPFFSNLLPEGRRLSTLKRSVKASLDDELSLLLPVGSDTIGDVSVVPVGESPSPPRASIDLTDDLDFSSVLSEAGVVDPIALPGVQDKASARTIAAPVRGEERSYILKISPPEYPALVENEAACLDIVRAAGKGYPVVESKLVRDRHGRSGLLVSRFDRVRGTKLHVEDAAQVMGLYPSEKYDPAMEDLANALSRVSSSPLLTARSIALQVAIAWLTGNGDLHAKNISLMWDRGVIKVAPIYDVPSTIPYGDTTLALAVQGKKDNLSAKIFRAFAADIGLPPKATESVMRTALSATDGAADKIIATTDFDPRRARDLRRVLDYRRRLWL
ncbi:HipA domain-containing protein [Corynebacterium sp. TA-R-1]|uniref:HipA domain-containing protein n=1 Tax=Corynebacterium stercoris TaxID=2943490 RepID=A0ABT1G100_9CORY|nr:HipA domain-containing protein [Corynebacterium stercoris]MCP1387702.1 HipA domain-containing protein [Corynebacterium stercoris]